MSGGSGFLAFGALIRPDLEEPMTTTAVRPSTRRDPLLTGTRVLLGAFGGFKLAGTAYFPFFATAEQNGDPEGLLDWSVGIWSTALASASIVAADPAAAGGPAHRAVVNGLLLVEIAFSLVKLFVYDEPEAVGFMAVDLVSSVSWRSSPGDVPSPSEEYVAPAPARRRVSATASQRSSSAGRRAVGSRRAWRCPPRRRR